MSVNNNAEENDFANDNTNKNGENNATNNVVNTDDLPQPLDHRGGSHDNESAVEEDTRSSQEFMVDLNQEYHDRALLANQRRFYKRSRRVGVARNPMKNPKKLALDVANKDTFKKNINPSKLTQKLASSSKQKNDKGLVAESFD
ncbi:hypothetical protein Tco_0146267 [Tanacetum coccineum]